MNLEKNGFTLVELAIALMVIGLLIGGVLKGQELIENARITRVVQDLSSYDTAVMIFRSTYNAIPGDMRNPSRLPNCNTAPCNQISASNSPGELNSPLKEGNFWRHLDRAGLIKNVNNDATDMRCISPVNAFDAHDNIMAMPSVPSWPDSASLRYTHWLKVGDSRTPGIAAPCRTVYSHVKTATRIDQKIDDGKPFTGIFRAFSSSNDLRYKCHHNNMQEYATVNPSIGCQGAALLPSVKQR